MFEWTAEGLKHTDATGAVKIISHADAAMYYAELHASERQQPLPPVPELIAVTAQAPELVAATAQAPALEPVKAPEPAPAVVNAAPAAELEQQPAIVAAAVQLADFNKAAEVAAQPEVIAAAALKPDALAASIGAALAKALAAQDVAQGHADKAQEAADAAGAAVAELQAFAAEVLGKSQ